MSTPLPSANRGAGGSGQRPRTAVGTVRPGSEFLIVNRTSAVWHIYSREELRGHVEPKGEMVIQAIGSGVVSAVLDGVPTARLTADLAAAIWGVEILNGDQKGDGPELRPLRRRSRAVALPSSASIEELYLLADTENALKYLGILTVRDALRAEADDILALPRYPLRCLFDLLEQVHGLIVD